MEELSRNRNNQAQVRITRPDGSSLQLNLGAGATRAVESFPEDERDAVLFAASTYAAEHPLGDNRFIWDNHIAAVTGGADDIPRWRRDRDLQVPAVLGPPQMPDGSDVLRVPRTAVAQLAAAATAAPSWSLSPGDSIRRTELHNRYGGSRQGGTIPSRTTPNIFLFLDKKVGGSHGYYDGWAGDRFYYTGHGQRGDQELRRGNLAVLNHATTGKALRVFRGVRGHVTYLGEFRLDPDRPWFRMEAPEAAPSHATRQVIVFRLTPVGAVLRESKDDVEFPPGVFAAEVEAAVVGTPAAVVTEVPVEQQHVEEVEVLRQSSSVTVARREQTLVLEYVTALEAAGDEVVRLRVRPSGEVHELICDVLDKTRNLLVEAKGTGSRGEVRMAIGQVLDYRRFVEDPTPKCGVLLPDRPRDDIEALLRSVGIAAVWKSGGGFIDNVGGAFTP